MVYWIVAVNNKLIMYNLFFGNLSSCKRSFFRIKNFSQLQIVPNIPSQMTYLLNIVPSLFIA